MSDAAPPLCRRCWPTIRGSTSGSGFPRRARSRVATGRVEIGQGVLTAMSRSPPKNSTSRPSASGCETGDTDADPERGLHRRQPVDPVRRRRAAPRLRRGARPVSRPCRGALRLCPRRPRRCADGAILRRGAADRPGLLVARRRGRSGAPRHRPAPPIKPASEHRVVGQNAPRVDLAAKVFGAAGLHPRHDARRHGACARRAPAAPRRARSRRVDEAAIRRAAKGADRDRPRRQFPRDPRRRRDRGRGRRRGGARPCRLGWGRPDQPVPGRGALAVAAALGRPIVGAPPADAAPARAGTRRAITPDAHRACLDRRRPAGWRSTATGIYRCGPISQGVYPLRAALARTLKLDPAAISVQARAGAGLLRP